MVTNSESLLKKREKLLSNDQTVIFGILSLEKRGYQIINEKDLITGLENRLKPTEVKESLDRLYDQTIITHKPKKVPKNGGKEWEYTHQFTREGRLYAAKIYNELLKPDENLIKKLKSIDVIFREPSQLKHGDVSEFYVDVKKAYGYPDILKSITDNLWKQMDKKTTCIATAGYGGLPPATVLSLEHNLKLTLVRDNPKKHGKGGEIDGYVPIEGDKISIIDDVFTTGGSLRNIIDVIKPTKAEILDCYVIVKRGKDYLGNVPLYSLLFAEDLL